MLAKAVDSRVRLRPIRPDDERRLLALWSALSPDTVNRRFFSPRRPGPEDAHVLASGDQRHPMAIVAEIDHGDEIELVGVAQYGPAADGTTADIGLLVADGWQGRGVGSLLLEELLRAAEQRGIREFSPDVLIDNRRTVELLARRTNVTRRTAGGDVTSLVFRRCADATVKAA